MHYFLVTKLSQLYKSFIITGPFGFEHCLCINFNGNSSIRITRIVTTFRFFIKSPEEGRLVRPKNLETLSRFCLCRFAINVYIFVLDKIAGFGCRHFV